MSRGVGAHWSTNSLRNEGMVAKGGLDIHWNGDFMLTFRCLLRRAFLPFPPQAAPTGALPLVRAV